MNSTQLRYRAERAKASRNQRHQETNTLRNSIVQVRLWFETHRNYLRRSGVTQALVLDNGDLSSARVFLEITEKPWSFLGHNRFNLGAALGFVTGITTGWYFGLVPALWVAGIVILVTVVVLPFLVRFRRYRVVIPFAQWRYSNDALVRIIDAVELATHLARDYESTNNKLCLAIKATGCAKASRDRSAWDVLVLKRRWKRRAA